MQESIQKLFQNNRSRSFIFSGAAGSGKTTSTMKLVQDLLHIKQSYDANLLWIDTKKEKISVDSIRNIQDFISKTSYSKLPKLVVIDSVDDLNVFAANALLKPLEEPTANCYFILISSNIKSVLPTIRSRCANIKFSMPSKTLVDSMTQIKFPDMTHEDRACYTYLAHNIPSSIDALATSQGLAFYTQMLAAIAAFSTKAETLYSFIDSNFTKEDQACKWQAFKILIRHLTMMLIKPLEEQRPAKLDHEANIITKLSDRMSMTERLSLYSDIHKLIYHTDKLSLSIQNTVLLTFYKMMKL